MEGGLGLEGKNSGKRKRLHRHQQKHGGGAKVPEMGRDGSSLQGGGALSFVVTCASDKMKIKDKENAPPPIKSQSSRETAAGVEMMDRRHEQDHRQSRHLSPHNTQELL